MNGTLDLSDAQTYDVTSTETSSTCSGSGAYRDIRAGTPVVVTNAAGRTLVSTALGRGLASSRVCRFYFSFAVSTGESGYVVSVSDRGEQQRSTFAQLRSDWLALTLPPRTAR